jgi:hypothetical protein
MHIRQAAHLGIFLLGAYLVVQSLAGLVDSFEVPLIISRGEQPIPDAVRSVIVAALMRIPAVALLGVAPGIVAMWRSRSWSEALFPAAEALPSISSSALSALSFFLVGSYFAVSGLGILLGGIAQSASSSELFSSYGIRDLGRGSTYLAAGVAMILWGRRLWKDAA